MKTIIQVDSYPARVALVPETDEDRRVIEELKFHFLEDKDSSVEWAYGDTDEEADFGAGVLTVTAWCNMS